MFCPWDNLWISSKIKAVFSGFFRKQTKSEKRILRDCLKKKKFVDTYEFHPGRKDIPQVCCSLIWP